MLLHFSAEIFCLHHTFCGCAQQGHLAGTLYMLQFLKRLPDLWL